MEPPKKKRKNKSNKKIPLYNLDAIHFEKDISKCLPKYQSKGMSDETYTMISDPNTTLSDLYDAIPSCLKEFEDSMKMWSLRNDFVNLCKEKINLYSPPYEGFNRWLFKIFSVQAPPKKKRGGRGKKNEDVDNMMNGIFPKFYRRDIHDQSGEVLLNELVNEIPFRIRKRRFTKSRTDLKRNVSYYFKRLDNFLSNLYQSYMYSESPKKKEEKEEQEGEEMEEMEDNSEKKNELKLKYEQLKSKMEEITKEIEEVGLPRAILPPPPPPGTNPELMIITSEKKLIDIPETVEDYFEGVFVPFDRQVKSFMRELIIEHSFREYYEQLFVKLSKFTKKPDNPIRIDSKEKSHVEILSGKFDGSIKIIRYVYRHISPSCVTSYDYFDEIQILKKHFDKLEYLYGIHVKCDSEKIHFNRCLYSMVKRYNTFIGNNNSIHHRFSKPQKQQRRNNNNNRKNDNLFSPTSEGTNFHAAAPENVFKFLNEEMDVGCELFASPFNCYFPRFCSAFMDTDVFFGSYGSFDFFLNNVGFGSFEVGPPYTVEVQACSARAVLDLVKRRNRKNSKPLSFVFFVAEWRDPVAEYHLLLEASEFTVAHFLLSGKQHYYISGGQHFPILNKGQAKRLRFESNKGGQKRKRSQKTNNEVIGKKRKQEDVADDGGEQRRYYHVPHGTHVYVVQNKTGRGKYPVSDDFEDRLRKVFAEKYSSDGEEEEEDKVMEEKDRDEDEDDDEVEVEEKKS